LPTNVVKGRTLIEKGSRLLRLPFRAFIECIFDLGGGGDSLAMADLTQFKTILS
jgi:hypothetical protein